MSVKYLGSSRTGGGIASCLVGGSAGVPEPGGTPTGDVLLLENGTDRLLLEDGFFVLLEENE